MINIKIYFFSILLLLTSFSNVFSYDTTAKTAIIKDLSTDTILVRKNEDFKIPPASMSKLMTLVMIFEGLKNNRINLDDKLRVSKKASLKGGSKMFLREGELVSIENLIKGIIVHSGNDACIVIAEGISGTEESFANDMNSFGKAIGLKDSFFKNSTGWPEKNHLMSARDLLFLSEYIIRNYPQYYFYFSQSDFTWDNITQKNRNPILNVGLGADGLKTGHTKEAGYGLVGSAKKGDRRIVFVISGMKSKKERKREAEKIVNWAFRNFESINLYNKGESISSLPVWLGNKDKINLTTQEDVKILNKIGETPNFISKIVFNKDIKAPIEKGKITQAKLIITIPSQNYSNNFVNKEYQLVANESVEKGGLLIEMKYASIKIFNFILKKLKFKS